MAILSLEALVVCRLSLVAASRATLVYRTLLTEIKEDLSKLQEIVEDRGAWWAAVCGVAELDTTQQLSNDK